jgi:porin
MNQLAQRGISFHAMFVEDWSREWNHSSVSDYGFGRYSLDFTLMVDGEKSIGWKGATASVRLKQHIREVGHGDDWPCQLYSNIDAPSRTTMYELWLEQKAAGSKFRLKLGKFDSNTEFAVVESAGDFLNSSMGFSPTIVNFPSYPEPKPGAGVFFSPIKNHEVKMGLFQSAGSGTLSLMEPGRRWSTKNDLTGRLSIGYWRIDGAITKFDGNQVPATQGVYSVFEQGLWRQTLKRHDGERVLSTFLQLGQADGDVSAMSGHVGGGLILQAPFSSRPGDFIGVGATRARLAAPASKSDTDEELILETFYKAVLAKNFVFEQDFQYLHQPKGISLSSGPVISSRLIFAF